MDAIYIYSDVMLGLPAVTTQTTTRMGWYKLVVKIK